MRFDGGAVDQNLCGRSAGLRERMEQVNPHAFRGPANVTVVKRFPRTVLWWRINPTAARLQHLHDAADHAPIVDARLAARICRQMWFDLRKLRVRQPELIPIHPRSLSEAVNHNPLIMPTLLWVRTLALQLPFCFEMRALSGSLVSSAPE
jgi:hypothetical protein